MTYQKLPDAFDPYTGMSKNGKGGTELMAERLFKRLPKDLTDKFQIIFSRIGEIKGDKDVILYCHDTYDDPFNEILESKDLQKRIKKFIFVSNYQFQTYHMRFGIPYNKSIVLPNGIVPIEAHTKPSDTINLIYHTTPHRGLELLLPVFNAMCNLHRDVELDVYSSFNIYGWSDRDKPYENLFDKLRNHDRIRYHGFKPNEVVRNALKKAHIFAYPNIWPETSAISVIEAMSAGCAIVCPDFAALPETTHDFAFSYRFNENHNDHANIHATVLNNVINKYREGKLNGHLTTMKNYADVKYNIDLQVKNWISFLRSIHE